jgi:hypothetical protein
MYTPEQRRRAEEVHRLHRSWHASNYSLRLALEHGVIAGTRLTARDVDAFADIYGQCPCCIAGKSTRPSFRHNSENPPATAPGEVLHIDILPINSKDERDIKDDVKNVTVGYLLATVCEFSGYLHLEPMTRKSGEHVQTALSKTFAFFRQYGHIVRHTVTDYESVLVSLDPYIQAQSIQPRHTPPYQHAQRIERYVRTLKDRMRSILASMERVLPVAYYTELYQTSALYMNLLPSSKHETMSPWVIVTGEKYDLARITPLPFGQLVMMHVDAPGAHAELGVRLGPDMKSVGSYRCVNLHTRQVVTRKHLTECPLYPVNFPWRRNRYYVAPLEPRGKARLIGNGYVWEQRQPRAEAQTQVRHVQLPPVEETPQAGSQPTVAPAPPEAHTSSSPRVPPSIVFPPAGEPNSPYTCMELPSTTVAHEPSLALPSSTVPADSTNDADAM